MLSNEDYLNIFHEIKNSITLISGSLQLVEKRHPEVSQFDYWKEAMSEITFLRNMVVQLSSAGLCSHLNLARVDVYDFMHQIYDSISTLPLKNWMCRLVMADALPQMEIDPGLLKQAIINIVKNAYEAMDNTGSIRIDVSLSEGLMHIAVTYHGGGLDPAFADNIFQSFTTSKTGGSDLGLVITKQIIDAHHGTLICDSRPGDGCTFTISLPLTQS